MDQGKLLPRPAPLHPLSLEHELPPTVEIVDQVRRAEGAGGQSDTALAAAGPAQQVKHQALGRPVRIDVELYASR